MEPDKEIAVVYGDVCLRRQKRKQQKSLIAEKFYDFADSTTLHGLRYITQRGLHPVEKLFWLVTFIISVLLCFYLMGNVWLKWETSPVIVSINEKLVGVDEIPFPSVTICPQMKNKRSEFDFFETEKQFFSHRHGYRMHTERVITNEYKRDLETFGDLQLICNSYQNNVGRAISNISVVNNLLKVAPILSDILLKHCEWRNKWIRCEDLFERVLTSEGVCYTMNTLASSEIFRTENLHDDFNYLEANQTSFNWTEEQGYLDWTSDSYPRPGMRNGANPDLRITLVEDINERDMLCNKLHRGFKIYVHHPADLPQTSLYYFSALPNQVSSMALKLSVSTSSQNMVSIPVEKRECYFPGERLLRYFQIYSQKNCDMECLTNHTFKSCGCVGFYMPYHISDRICSIGSSDCMATAKGVLARQRKKESSSNIGCNCLPSCYSIDYDADILKSDFDYREHVRGIFKSRGADDEAADDYLLNKSYSIIELFYKQPHFMSYKRSELFGKTDFLANCGGLLGLFLGFSFLSLVEIIYFITLRIWCALARDAQEQKDKN